MKRWLFFSIWVLLIYPQILIGQVHVKGYYRKDGTYVQPHYRSSPDGDPYNNYSYPGNANPYTGKVATGNPETYLNNYYYKKGGGYSYAAFPLYSVNYKSMDIRPLGSYELYSSKGESIGRLVYSNGDIYKLFDTSGTYWGYVEKKGRHRLTVYDEKGHKVNRSGGGGAVPILSLLAGAFAFVFLISSGQ